MKSSYIKRVFFTFFLISFFVGCSNKQVSKEFLTNKNNSLDTIFSKILYKNDDKPYIYQMYSFKKGKIIEQDSLVSDFEEQVKLICSSRGGKMMSLFEFINKYKISRVDMLDRCFINLGNFNLCVVDHGEEIPTVLFVWNDSEKESHRYRANYVYTTIIGGRKFSYIGNAPSKIDIDNVIEAEKKVCIPDKDNWKYFFISAKKAYMIKEKEKKLEIQKRKQQEERKNTFRRF